jgi:TolB-like protein
LPFASGQRDLESGNGPFPFSLASAWIVSELRRFLAELKHRRVYRVAVLYAAAAFAAAQAADLFLPRLGLPDWTVTAVVVLAVVGFPLALIASWIFDITPTGLRRTTQDTALTRREVWRLVVGSAVGLLVLGSGGWWVSTMASRPPPTIDRLAVLPLANLMNDAEQDYFVQGMHDALISELAQAGIVVIARTSVMQYQQTTKPIREIARELNVGALIEGSVLRAQDSVRIRVQLVDGRTEANLWAQSYEGALTDVLALHRNVTHAVAREIRSTVTPRAYARMAAARSVDPEAYEAYLKGVSYLERGTQATRETALHFFHTALERDPAFALAHIGVYQVWAGLQQAGIVAPEEAAPKMRAALDKARELDDALPELHHALATKATWTDWDWPAADSSFRRAIELNPNQARTRALYSHYLHIMRRPAEAMLEIERATELDAYNPVIQALAGGSFLMARRYDEALTHFRNALRLAPGSLLGLVGVSNALHAAGRYEEAYLAEREYVMAGPGDPELEGALALGYGEAGYAGAMRRGAELLAQRSLTTTVPPDRVARLYLRAGEQERALEWLEREYDDHSPNLPYISSGHSIFDPLRRHPRFGALLRKMNLPE